MKHSGKLKRNISAKKNLIGSDIHLINIPTAMATGGFDVLLLQDVDQEVVSFNADEVERLEPYMEAASNDLKILKSGEVDHTSDEMLGDDDDWILDTTKIKEDGSTEDVKPISIITIEDGAVLTPVGEIFSPSVITSSWRKNTSSPEHTEERGR